MTAMAPALTTLESPRAARHLQLQLTHMNRGRNAYQASHCYSLADCMVEAEAPSAGEQLRSDCEAASKRCREPADRREATGSTSRDSLA
jgi:hypothetical protein